MRPSNPLAWYALLVCACAMPWVTAHAHIGPSVRENNRYLKLTLYGNRLRLLYTVYLGEQPGRQARHRMDADRNGEISEAEARAFGDELAASVATNLELDVDGKPVAPRWSSIDVGLGLTTVSAGAFSVDLVQWICLPSPAGTLEHRLTLYDHGHPPQAGETELRVEPSSGVTVVQSRLGIDNPQSQLHFKWLESRPPHPLDREGLHIAMTVDPDVAETTIDAACAAGAPVAGGDVTERTAVDAPSPSAEGRDTRRWAIYAGAAGALLVVLLALVAIGRRTGSSR